MKKQAYNPYLPLYEYVPDGEPHVFEGRVYVYGSHDRFGAFSFCRNSYVTWSAPLEDLKSWRYEGEIYSRTEDPDNRRGKRNLFAPDVTKGADGKYYLYYAYDWIGHIGVAMSESPAGPFHYLGRVRYPDGTVLGHKKGDRFQFDPGVITTKEGRTFLYSGFGPDHWFPQIKWGVKADGCYVVELDKDMQTIISGPCKVMDKKGLAKDASLGHEFFEASSIREMNGMYYLLYSTINGHELAYATSQSPFGPFTYKGVIISNGDVGICGRDKSHAAYPLGNNHGGLLQVKDKWYVFYHRHTNYTNTDRQGCAEEIKMEEDGFIPQAEMTSCGLNGGPLEGKGNYPASICCLLIPKEGNVFYPFFRLPSKNKKLYITQYGNDDDTVETQYVKNMQDGSLIGYKYFNLKDTKEVILKVKGNARGVLEVRYQEKGPAISQSEAVIHGEESIRLLILNPADHSPLYFYFRGKGKFDFYSFELR